ncbi:zinc ABC transporter substrate-binding protein [Loktanella sp. R86503]|uniref:zinc ABC transporter substrate-binding protein n=1 Tax=Loktanella sp. R86503 TaxID=3093847 RepID=UPI0036DB2D1B
MIRSLSAALVLSATQAFADAPIVVTDIAPIHSLVTQVMAGVGTPELLVPPGADAHSLALRPSDARKLSQAEIIVWVGPSLTPWLSDPLETLAPAAAMLTLLDVPGWAHREMAEGHDHGAEEEHGDHAVDPHAWLDPEIAMVWVRAIRNTLVTSDPDNASTYTANAGDALAGLMSLHDRITADLAGVQPESWIAPHAAYGYFSDRYNVPAADAVADSDAEAPGPTHLAELRALVEAGTVTCVMSETHAPTDYATLLTEGTDARTAVIDDTGMTLDPGPALYRDLLSAIATQLKDCAAS